MTKYDIGIEILQKTHDGDWLNEKNLYLLQEYINGHLTAKGIAYIEKLYSRIMKMGYVKR